MTACVCRGTLILLYFIVIFLQYVRTVSHVAPQALIEEVLASQGSILKCDVSTDEVCHQAFTSLFHASEALFQRRESLDALKVVTLCHRLFGRNLEFRLLLAQLSCRYRQFSEARKRFASADAMGIRVCHHENCTLRRDGVFDLLVAGKTAFGMCMMEARKFAVAAEKFREALGLNNKLDAIAWHLGLACDYGQDWHGAVVAYQQWMRIVRGKGREVVIPTRPPDKISVVIFCLSRVEGMPQGWGPSSLQKHGIGGSEEAVILLSRELSALGFYVEVYAHPPDEEVGPDEHGVVWLPVHVFEASKHAPHVFVSWRGYALATLGGAAALNFLWLHDRVIPQLLAPAMLPDLAGILVLSNHHGDQLPPHAKHKAISTRNGLESSFFRDGPNRPHEFIFASHPERGLEQLLLAWQVIRSGVPGAVLRVYHGFPRGYGK